MTNGIVFCAINSWITGRRLVSLPFADHCEPLFQQDRDLRESLEEIKKDSAAQEWNYIQVRPFSAEARTVMERAAFCPAETFHLHTLDLRPDPETLLRACDKDSVQRKIRRAEREGLSYQEGRSEELLAEFHRLLVLTRRRHHVPPQPIAWFRNLAQTMGENLKVRVACTRGRAIASIISLSHNGTMVYKYGCSDLSYSNLGGTALLFWRMIEDAKATGCHTLDIGRSDNDNPGLIRFKSNWGASDCVLTYWRYPTAAATAKRFEGKGSTLARHIVSCLPDRMFVALGEMMYRHIG